MNKDELKVYLSENKTLIMEVLEDLGFKSIKSVGDRYIVCGFPNKRRKDGINVRLNPNLTVKIWSENTNIKDFYDLVKETLKCDFPTSLNYIANIVGIKLTNSKSRKIDLFKIKPKREKKKYERAVNKALRYKTEDRFIREDCELFLIDGIDSKTQELFEVSFDSCDGRIVFPIKDYEGNILTFKGRTIVENYDSKGIAKYLYYNSFDGRKYLYGYFENFWYIDEAEDVIIPEAEKGVQQLCSMKIRNAVSTSKKCISWEQREELILLGKSITIAFDKDVSYEEIISECKKFDNRIEVYYIWDKDNLLKGKESPMDKGIEVFNLLYTKYRFKYEG